MKKALSMLLAIVMVLSLLPMNVFAASNPTISLTTDFTTELEVGGTFTVTAKLADNTRFDGLTLTLKWNENAVKFTGFNSNRGTLVSDVCGGEGYTPASGNTNGKFVALDTTGYGYDKNGMIFVANFEIVGDGALDIGLKTDDPTVFMMVANNEAGEQFRLEPTLDCSALNGLTVGGKPVGPEMPEDAPFTAITTDAGSITSVELTEEFFSGESTYIDDFETALYTVAIPEDATEIYITIDAARDDFTNQFDSVDWEKVIGVAAMIANVNDSTDCEASYFETEETDDGKTIITIPVEFYNAPMMGGEAKLYPIVKENEDDDVYAVGPQMKTMSNMPLCLFTFVYGDTEPVVEYNISIDENMVGGTIYACDEDGNEITKAKAGETVYVDVEADKGYTTTGAYYINGQLANDFMFVMPEEDVILSATFTATHTCEFKEVVADEYLKDAATCQHAAEYFKSCECGATSEETFFDGETVGCVYENGVCKWCGEAATEPILSFTAGGQTLEAVTAEDYCSEFAVTAQKLTVTVPAGVNIVTINCAASMCAYIDHVSSDLSPSGKSAEIDLTQDLTFVCVPVTLDDGSDAYYHVYFEQEAGDVDPEPEDPAVTPGYSFATSADVSAENGGTAVVKVKITGHSDPNVKTYNAYDLTLTYDSTRLKYVSGEGAVSGDKVEIREIGNTIQIVGVGEAKGFDVQVATLTFETLAQGPANVTISKVQVSAKSETVSADIPEAMPKHDENDTTNKDDETPGQSVIVVPYTVNKPDFVSGNNKILHGEDYTFSYTDTTNYTYSDLIVKVGGTQVEFSQQGDVYTIENVTGPVEITATQKAKVYNVTVTSGGATVEAAATATYGTDYIFTVTPGDMMLVKSVKVTKTADETAEISYTINEDGAYVIAGTDITADFTINVTQEDKPVAATTLITFTGVEETEVEGGLNQTAEVGKAFTFRLNKDENFTYTAKVGETDLVETPAVEETPAFFTIPAELVVEGGVTVNITKTRISHLVVEVKEYVNLKTAEGEQAKTMFLVTAKDDALVLTYDGQPMYYSTRYGVAAQAAAVVEEGTEVEAETEIAVPAGAYCWLIVSTDNAEVVKEAALAKIAVAAEETVAPTVAYDNDVNQTTMVDVNDAQLAYDMYMGAYEINESVTMDKFLEADASTDGKLDVNDVVTIIRYIIEKAAN